MGGVFLFGGGVSRGSPQNIFQIKKNGTFPMVFELKFHGVCFS